MNVWKLATIVPLLVWSSAAAAQASESDQAQVGVAGTVAPLCILGIPSRATVDVGQMVATSGTRVGRITVLAVQTVTLPNSFCNFAGSTVTVSATALVANNTAAVQTGFARAVNYTASATNWAASATIGTTAATAGGTNPVTVGNGAVQPAPKLANLTVEPSNFTAPSDLLLVSGTYSGVIVITLGPAAVAS